MHFLNGFDSAGRKFHFRADWQRFGGRWRAAFSIQVSPRRRVRSNASAARPRYSIRTTARAWRWSRTTAWSWAIGVAKSSCPSSPPPASRAAWWMWKGFCPTAVRCFTIRRCGSNRPAEGTSLRHHSPIMMSPAAVLWHARIGSARSAGAPVPCRSHCRWACG